MSPLTFLFTDLEGSTRTWEREPDAMERWLACHDGLVTDCILANGGRVFKHSGDGLCAVFESSVAAARAARAVQVGLAAACQRNWPPMRFRVLRATLFFARSPLCVFALLW